MFRALSIFAFATLALFAVMLRTTPAAAQLPQIAESRLGVDSLKLEGGKRLFGFMISQRSDRSIVFAVEREWLKVTHPQLFDSLVDAERVRFAAARTKRIDRITDWIKARPEDRGLIAFLEHELTRFSDALPEVLEQKRFIGVELTATEYRELFRQPPERRKIAGLAFQYELESVTTSPVNQLREKLIENGVDIEKSTVDLSHEIVTTVAESDREWAARKAIVEYTLRKPLEYQGTASMLVKKSQTVDVSTLVAQFMGGGAGMDSISQLGAELGLPEFKKLTGHNANWWMKATEEAEKDGFCGVTILRLEQNMLSSKVRVEAFLLAMEQPGKWFQVAMFVSEANAAEQTAEQLKQIQDDPQVKSTLDALTSLGLGDQSLINQALQHGAATQKAMQNASGQLNMFISQHSRSLDSLPILLQP